MKIKDILTIIEQDKDFRHRIELYKSKKETHNIGEVLEHNYQNWLNTELKFNEN